MQNVGNEGLSKLKASERVVSNIIVTRPSATSIEVPAPATRLSAIGVTSVTDLPLSVYISTEDEPPELSIMPMTAVPGTIVPSDDQPTESQPPLARRACTAILSVGVAAVRRRPEAAVGCWMTQWTV